MRNIGEKTAYILAGIVLVMASSTIVGVAFIVRQKESAAVFDKPSSGYLDVVLFDERTQ